MLAEPPRSPYDLNFVCFNFHCRVHPWFWAISVILGLGGLGGAQTSHRALMLVLWVCVMFVSILVHELGHAILMRYYGENARIVLYAMGGLAISEGGMLQRRGGRSGWQQVLISFAGPAAGFLLAGLTVVLIYAMGGKVLWEAHFPIFWRIQLPPTLANPALYALLFSMLYVNFLWGLLNLLPIYPLDGGQISRELFLMKDTHTGIANSLMLSILTAGALAGWAIIKMTQGDQGAAVPRIAVRITCLLQLPDAAGRGRRFRRLWASKSVVALFRLDNQIQAARPGVTMAASRTWLVI